MYSATNDDKSIKNSAGNVKDEVCDAAQKAGRSVRGFITTASDEISNASHAINERIESKPLQSSLIALGAGVILGMLIKR